jgi:epoxyqueuosine reductase
MAISVENDISSAIKSKAAELGFHLCGIARARALNEYEPTFRAWLDAGMNDIMEYLSRDIEKRFDPLKLYPDAKSVIVTGISYYSDLMQNDPSAPLLSRYTYGNDYHEVIREKLGMLLDRIREFIPEAEGRIAVDSSNVLEKAWAREAGLGWQGRHSVIINKEIGSFFFIGIIILNAVLEYDAPVTKDYCGECRLCVQECPTGAINGNRTIDARKCIANLTIERRGAIPESLEPFLGRRIYGCDRCQEVCPWNKDLKVSGTPEFKINPEIAAMTTEQWKNLSRENFERLFRKTSMSRVKYEKLKANIESALK